jgi:transcription initiation factor TFIIB
MPLPSSLQGPVIKTKKNAQGRSKKEIKKLWTMFDEDVVEKKQEVECLYNKDSDGISCHICGHRLMINELNFMTCTNTKCAVIFTEMTDTNAEWRFYGGDESGGVNPTRCGMPTNPILLESSFGCKVLCDYKSNYEMRKIRRYTEWQAMPYREKSQYDEFQRITTMAHQSGIPRIIIDDAIRLHKRISEQKTFRGVNRDGIIAASIYIASRMNGTPRTPKEIAAIFHLDVGSSTKGCKNATLIINELETDMANGDKTAMCSTKPEAFIQRYCSKLNMNEEFTKLSLFIAIKIDRKQLIPQNTPHAIAAGVIYFIGSIFKLNITKSDVHRVSDISEVTINKCFKELKKHMDLVPTMLLKKYNIV